MEYFHLTTPQQNIWNLQKYYENTAIANLCGAIFFQEKRDSLLLQEAIRQFIRSQSGIRLRFCEGEEPGQYVSDEVDEAFPVMAFSSRAEFDCYAESFAREPIGLLNRQMYRFVVFRLEQENRSGILVVLSHLISDAWTFGLMANQIDMAYRKLAGETGIPLLEGDYLDFIQSEEQYLGSERYGRDKSYWERKYTARPETSPVKLCQSSMDTVEAKRMTRTLPSTLEQRIAAYCKAYPVSQAVLFETALIIYLSRINPELQSVTIGVPVLNRSSAKEKEIAGMFVSTMPLTTAVTGDMEVLELAGQITKEHMELFRHQKYPYAGILRQLREKQDFSGNLYDVMVSYQNAKTKTGAETQWYSNGCSEVPLLIHIDNRDGKECHTINVDYQTAVFRDEAEVELLIDRLEYILGQIVAEAVEKVGDTGIVPQREYDRIVYGFNDTYVDYPREKCVHELFMEQAAKMPERTALVFEDQKFTYRKLDEMSNSLAHFLREKGIQPGDVVPIIAKRSWHVIVAMLGVLKAGGAYMPVSPEFPLNRIQYMFETADVKLAVTYGYSTDIDDLNKCRIGTEMISLEEIDYFGKTSPVQNRNEMEDLCYIIFTSGSTGEPKGVAVNHRNVSNYCHNNNNNVCHKVISDGNKRIVSVTNIIFDIFVTESLLPLVNGLTIYLADDEEIMSQDKLSKLIKNNKIDVMQTTPTKMKSYMLDRDNIDYLSVLRTIILGGEAFPEELYREISVNSKARVFNIYGPAETTVWSTNEEIKDERWLAHEQFERMAAIHPDTIALVAGNEKYTYRELDEKSNALAQKLIMQGTGAGKVIGAYLDRTAYVVLSQLAVLKAGGVFLPVDHRYPKDRIKYMLEDCQVWLVISDEELGREWNVQYFNLKNYDFGNVLEKTVKIRSEAPCYIIYTSGSTGKPKGCVLKHVGVANFCANNNIVPYAEKLDHQTVISVNTISFDFFIAETLLSLAHGWTVVLAGEEESNNKNLFKELVVENGVNIIETTPTRLEIYAKDEKKDSYLQQIQLIVSAGEALSESLLEQLETVSSAKIYNPLGPSECSVWNTDGDFKADITIGSPIANTQIYILDKAGYPLPIGVAGELCISGDGVGGGYLNRPELTAEKFVPNPFATEENHHGKVMYHTGDLARWRADGEIEYLGRIDTQVKIRGLRIELGEIESVMSSFPGIRLTAVADKQDKNNRQYLVGYYTGEGGIDEKELRAHLSAKLPRYMVPNYFMRLDTMPMTASGKTDRKNLPVPDFTQQTAEYAPPETDTEKKLAAIWQELLQTERIGRTDDFFELGGDSLLAISMLGEIEKSFHVEVSVREVMEHSELEALARCLENACGAVCPDTADGGMAGGTAAGRITAHHADRYLLLPQQKAVYAACMKEPGTLAYNMPARIILPDAVDRDRLKGSIAKVLDRHKLLKSFIRMEETGLYGVYDGNARIVFEEYETGKEDTFVRPFDLGEAPLVRVGFIEDALLFDMHHIIADGASMNILLREIATVYGGGILQEQGAEYPDYAEYFYGMDKGEHKAYFQEMLKCDREPVSLPETKKSGTGGGSRLYKIPEEVFAGARKYARENGLTDTMLFLGAYGILLSKYTGRKEILSSIILQNRTHVDTRGMVGMFVNTLPVCLALGKSTGMGDNTAGYMQEVKEKLLGLYRYQELPFEDISEAVGMNDRSAVNTSFVYQGDGEKILSLDGQELTPLFMDTHTAKFDLTMELTPTGNGCRFRMEYNLAKYEGQLMDGLAEGYIRILGQLWKEKLADISVLSEEEYHRIVEGFNDTFVDYPRGKCVHELFTEQAAKTPERTALVFENQKFTYRQLDEMSNTLAHFLRAKGIKPNDVVPIIAKRSWHIIVAMLGVLKAGGAYMLIDYQYPADRISYLVKECKADIFFVYGCEYADAVDLGSIDYFKDTEPIKSINMTGDVLCVIHTSGSTGVPKVTALSHENIAHYIDYSEKLFRGTKQTIATTAITFDAFIQETLVSLCRQVPVILLNEIQATNQNEFEKAVGRYKDSFLFQTPTKLQSYIRNSKTKEFLSRIASFVIGGEVFPQELYDAVRTYNPDGRIYNIYGPTETTVCAVVNELREGTDITIGTPIANTQIYILDSDQRPVPIGVPGELCIAGEGVGKGYLNRPELTAERFVQNPFATEENHHGKIIYRTGDLAHFRSDGEIEYLGRMDTQVKIRGLRIELGEIESVMGSFPGIGLCAVADKRDEAGRQYLVGYYTLAADAEGYNRADVSRADIGLDESALREHLSAKLPRYMVPNYFLRLDTMPMTASGKTDRKNLPVPDFAQLAAGYVAPETDMEKRLAEFWQELLRVEKVGRTDDFFALGGDSLLAISMLSEIEQSFHVEISVREVMEHSELCSLAQCLENAAAVGHFVARHAERYELLPQQKAVYAACMKEPDSLVYNMPAQISLPDTVDRDRLKKSIARVLDCHKLLKSCIRMEETGLYGIYDEKAKVEFGQYEKEKENTFVRPFDLSRAPLVRVGFTEDALLFDMHHIIADGASMNILLREIASVYEGGALREPEVDYPDYASYFYGLNMKEHRAYFQEMLRCDMEPVALPETKNPQKGGESRLYRIPGELFAKAREYARKNGLTDTMVFLGAYGILLSKYTGKKEVLSSIILQNRTHADTREMVGMFVNTLPVCLVLGDSVADYMQEVKKHLLNLFRYQELPFEDISEAAGMDRSVINTSFVYQGDGEKVLSLDGQRLMPRFIDTHTAKFDLSMELTPTGDGCVMRLEYNCEKYDGQLMDGLADAYLRILGQLDREKPAEVSVLSEAEYHKVMEEFNDTYVDYPRGKCVHELFMEQAAKTPERTALVFEDQKFTYRQLDEMSNSLAHFLRGKGVKPGDVVPIIAKRSWHIIVAMLGVLKAGGAYMPVDPNYPEDRVNYMLETSGSRLALVHGYEGMLSVETIRLNRFGFGENTAPVGNINSPEDSAYIIFTSGSTGKPKGVMVCHRNICNYADNNAFNSVCHKIIDYPCRSIVSVTNIIFDIFVTESLLPLVNGLCIYFASDAEAASQSRLGHLVEKNSIDVLQTTPTKMRSYLMDRDNTGYLKGLRAIILGGEAFPQELYHILRNLTDAHIYNIYGPAETTVWSTNAEVTSTDITIGTPIANTQIYILDSDQRPVPIGVPGELCIAGEGVGKGYLNRPELTAERFVPNPFATEENHHGKIMYRTGDLARFRSDGEIEYLGRMDTQVKIRGLRIELGEIESVMGSFPGIGLCAVADKRDETGRQYLVGYYTVTVDIERHSRTDDSRGEGNRADGSRVESKRAEVYRAEENRIDGNRTEGNRADVSRADGNKADGSRADIGLDEKALREYLSAKLPRYMVPNYFLRLEAMPMTASGKTDRKNLPVPDFTQSSGEYVPPVTEKEKELCRLMEELLHMEQVGVTDDFFNLGGDSLTAIEFVAKAHDRGIGFALQNIFDYPTVRQLCDHMEAEDGAKILYEPADFDKYRSLLAENVIDEAFVPERKSLGNVLLTGATGFLGAHVLDRLLKEETGKVYCLVRDGEKAGGSQRLREILNYYFGERYEAEFEAEYEAGFSAEPAGKAASVTGIKEGSDADSESGRQHVRRIIPIIGDIERNGLAENMPEDVQTVIHTAASVKHYGSYDYFNRINVEGTKHVVSYAKSVGARLIHISTLSVSGNSLADEFSVYRSEEEKFFGETSLYIGQPLDNVYIHSKFEAERVVLDAMLTGLDARIIRVGNLTSRATDYKFQPNYKQNAFLTRFKAVLEFGLFPDYLMHLYSEFSPIDLTAEGVVKIAQYAGKQTVFHLNSNRPIYFDRFLEVVHELGIPMKVVDGDTFTQALRGTIRDRVTEYIFEAFQNDMDERGRLVYDSNIHIENDFTVWFLKKLGFEWNETDMEYIRGYVEYFRKLGYLTI